MNTLHVANTISELLGKEINERVQAVEDIRALGRMGANICPLCAHYNHGEGGKQCIACPKMDNWEWHGIVKKEAEL